MMQVPVKFISHLLDKFSSKVDGVKETSHWRAPILTGITTKLHYKTFNWDALRNCIEEQNIVKLKKTVHYQNGKLVSEESVERLGKSAAEILNDVDASIDYNTPRHSVLESAITVNEGEEGYTREIEFVWFTDLFSKDVQTGKLMLRLFVSKANI